MTEFQLLGFYICAVGSLFYLTNTICLYGTGRKKSLGRQKFIWDGNVKMDLEEIRWEEVDWIDLIEERNKWRPTVSAVTNFCVVVNSGELHD